MLWHPALRLLAGVEYMALSLVLIEGEQKTLEDARHLAASMGMKRTEVFLKPIPFLGLLTVKYRIS